MLKIAEFTDTFLPVVDGVGRVVLAYAQELSALGHQVSVITPMNDAGYRGGLPFEVIDYLAYKVPTARQYRTGTAYADAHYRKRIAMVKPDILHAHGPFSAGREALRLARRRNLPLVASFHSKYYDDFYKAVKSDAIAKIALSSVVSFYQKCDEVWAVSRSTAQVLWGYGYEGDIHVMPNGVVLREVSEDALHQLEERYRFGDTPVLLFVGQINWKKNILRVLEAAAILKRQDLAFHLAFAGQGPDEDAIKEKAEELGIAEHCLFLGHVSDAALLDALYHRADLFTFPSLYDNAPMVLRESAVMGTPAVLVRGSDAAEIVKDKENGYLCEDTSEDLAKVITEALSDREKLAAVGKAAKATIPLPWPDVMRQVVAGYERCIENYRSKPRAHRKSAKAEEDDA